ncbi:F510_1955 family glycosylhydrolase [Sinobaca sp. H24]|uniref:F510_1955 family glycosylhydrolase n=1 Tax=Sinobaca sp. H24 TaxID=2923376 RepID=UPI00207A1055|nr:hypothetical protein [Sinobaca sp. H24]
MKKWYAAIGASMLIFAAACGGNEEPAASEPEEKVTFSHIHGAGFTADGEHALIPAHDGLRKLENGSWKVPEGEAHDYMGFTMTDSGFYSSGHPSQQTDYANPFGLVKSTDQGNSIDVLGMEGEVDFHIMDAGYESHVIYAVNPQPHDAMPESGLYRSEDESSWELKNMEGLEGEVLSLSAHPTDSDLAAAGTIDGVYLSRNEGDTFAPVSTEAPVPALTFLANGNLLYAEGTGTQTKLIIADDGELREIPAPDLKEGDSTGYIAQNPKHPDTLLVTTTERDIFYTEDQGNSWEKQADAGEEL